MPRALPLILGLTIAAVVFLVVPAIVRRIGTFNRLVIGIALLSPLAATGVEVARGKMHPSARNVLVGYGLYAFRVCYLLGVQFALLPLMFLVGPVWLLAIFITLADVVVRFLPSVQNLPLPPLCGFVHIGPLDCVPALVAYHAVNALVAFVAIRYGGRIMNSLAEWYRQAVQWFNRQLQVRG